jgi:hypothetical protein
MAGGSLADIPVTDRGFLTAAADMRPVDVPGKPAGQWTLGGKNGKIVYINKAGDAQVDLSGMNGTFLVRRIDPATGTMQKTTEKIHGGKVVTLSTPASVILWITN